MAMSKSRLEIILCSVVIILLVLILFLMMNKRKEYFKNSVATTTPAPIPICPNGYDYNGGAFCNQTKKCPDNFTIDSKSNCVLSSCPPNFTLNNGNCVLSSCPPNFTLNKGNCDLSSCPPNFSFDNKSKICKPISVTPGNVGRPRSRFPNCGSMDNNIIINSWCCKRKEGAAPNSNKESDYDNYCH